ncbi:unnamed protein product [Polarella glacialis]|uniref:Uncharacterized protein n=1 Tax=Polarella glacialis TaxID=89957 RepID=A0A813I3W7_POLGL|nr:unnamed protein product [Polarella glacialis]
MAARSTPRTPRPETDALWRSTVARQAASQVDGIDASSVCTSVSKHHRAAETCTLISEALSARGSRRSANGSVYGGSMAGSQISECSTNPWAGDPNRLCRAVAPLAEPTFRAGMATKHHDDLEDHRQKHRRQHVQVQADELLQHRRHHREAAVAAAEAAWRCAGAQQPVGLSGPDRDDRPCVLLEQEPQRRKKPSQGQLVEQLLLPLTVAKAWCCSCCCCCWYFGCCYWCGCCCGCGLSKLERASSMVSNEGCF